MKVSSLQLAFILTILVLIGLIYYGLWSIEKICCWAGCPVEEYPPWKYEESIKVPFWENFIK